MLIKNMSIIATKVSSNLELNSILIVMYLDNIEMSKFSRKIWNDNDKRKMRKKHN